MLRLLLEPIRLDISGFQLAFRTGRDSAFFGDKGTTGLAQNLATGRMGQDFLQAVPFQDKIIFNCVH